MKYLAADISGKVENYDNALYQAMTTCLPEDAQLVFACPYYTIAKNAEALHLHSYVSKKHRQSVNPLKRMIKVMEGVCNYSRLYRHIKRTSPDVLHLQWLPFLEVCNWEKHWLRKVHAHFPNIKIVLTLHNIYPHNSKAEQQKSYRKRMAEVMPFISQFIVHTQSSKQKAHDEFGIALDKITVIPHGIFMPEQFPKRERTDKPLRLLIFGQQSPYKGTDLFVEAIEQLPTSYRQNVDIHIIGSTDRHMTETYLERAQKIGITWQNTFIEEQQLFQEIQDSDILVYPYRAISQSGALLLGIAFQKPIILSDLPSFQETMGKEYPQELFCKKGDIQSLSQALTRCIDQYEEYKKRVVPVLQTIIEENSWKNAALKTIALYNEQYATR